jgi:hypothetical protein
VRRCDFHLMKSHTYESASNLADGGKRRKLFRTAEHGRGIAVR